MSFNEENVKAIFKQNASKKSFIKEDEKKEEIPEKKEIILGHLKSKRRSKKDKIGRNYKCGCGKQYLSYPALYTHIRTKHEGKEPEGTEKQNQAHKNKGRPPKNKLESLTKDYEYKTDLDNEIDDKAFWMVEDIKEFENLITDEDFFFEKYDAKGSCDPIENFPKLSCDQFHPIFLIIQKFQDLARQDNYTLDFSIYNPRVSVNNAFALFLYLLSKKAKAKFYNYVMWIVLAFYECFEEHGRKAIIEFYSLNMHTIPILKLKKSEPLCSMLNCDYIFLIADMFLRDFLPTKFPRISNEFAREFIWLFNQWMIHKKLTKIKLKFFS